MICAHCGAGENLEGERKHAVGCVFYRPSREAPDLEGCTGPAQLLSPAQAAKPDAYRVLQLVVNLVVRPNGEPARATVLISGVLSGQYDVTPGSELSVGDAVDIALANAGRVLLSAPLNM